MILEPKELSLFAEKAWAIGMKLTSIPKIGGLEISDSGVTFILLEKKIQTFSLPFVPGTIREGKIEDAVAVLGVLKQLHRLVEPHLEKRVVPIALSLPSSLVFTQSFSVPNVGHDRLEESAQLNLQMLSPIPADRAYMSWQFSHEKEDHFELLGAFTEREMVDRYRSLLEEARFMLVAIEFPSLSLTRLITETKGSATRSTLGFQISSSGLTFFIFRDKALYFNYFRSWHSIQGDQQEIPKSVFENVVAQEVQRVMNFGLSKFKESIQDVFLIAPGFEEEMQGFLQEKFGLTIIPFAVEKWNLTPLWFVALGSALRGQMSRTEDRFISLAPTSSAELFFQERVLSFISLWRNVFITTLLVFLIFFGSVAYSLFRNENRLKRELGDLRVSVQQQGLVNLENIAAQFNRLVKVVGEARQPADSWNALFERMRTISDANRIQVDRLEIPSLNDVITLSARAESEEAIIQFKNALGQDPYFSQIELDIGKIPQLSDRTFGFTFTFRFRKI